MSLASGNAVLLKGTERSGTHTYTHTHTHTHTQTRTLCSSRAVFGAQVYMHLRAQVCMHPK